MKISRIVLAASRHFLLPPTPHFFSRFYLLEFKQHRRPIYVINEFSLNSKTFHTNVQKPQFQIFLISSTSNFFQILFAWSLIQSQTHLSNYFFAKVTLKITKSYQPRLYTCSNNSI